jgi:hypothetical protein
LGVLSVALTLYASARLRCSATAPTTMVMMSVMMSVVVITLGIGV